MVWEKGHKKWEREGLLGGHEFEDVLIGVGDFEEAAAVGAADNALGQGDVLGNKLLVEGVEVIDGELKIDGAANGALSAPFVWLVEGEGEVADHELGPAIIGHNELLFKQGEAAVENGRFGDVLYRHLEYLERKC